jgi:hypothetical protein
VASQPFGNALKFHHHLLTRFTVEYSLRAYHYPIQTLLWRIRVLLLRIGRRHRGTPLKNRTQKEPLIPKIDSQTIFPGFT